MRRKRHLLQIAEKSIQRVWDGHPWSGRNGGDRPLEARRRDAPRGMAHVGIAAPRRDDTAIPGRYGPRREETRSDLSNTSRLRAMTTSHAAATVTPVRDPADYDDDALDRLADRIADRLAVRLGVLTPVHPRPESLVDAAEIARLHGKTRSWVYEHAGELRAVRLGSGPRPRLAFSPRSSQNSSRRSTSLRRSHSRRLLSVGVGARAPVAPRRGRRCCMCDPSTPRSALVSPWRTPSAAGRLDPAARCRLRLSDLASSGMQPETARRP